MGKKWLYIIIAAVLVVVLAVGGTIFYTTSNNYVAKVNGEKITKAEYKFFLRSVKSQMASMGITDMTQKVQNKTAGELVREGAMESATEYKIQLVKAKENNVKLTSEEEKTIESGFETNVIQQSGGSKLEADKKIQEELGISLEDYKAIYKGYYLTQKFASEEAKKIKASDDEIKKYYDENKDSVDKVTVRHILFMTVDQATNQPLSEEKIKEAEKKANEALARANAGEDFAALAKELTEDPGSKETGGEYTFKKDGQMVPEFEDWAFKATKVGETGIVKTSYGYHVMKFEKRTTFDEVKEDAKNALLGKKYVEELEKWKKDPTYKAVTNDKAINSIPI